MLVLGKSTCPLCDGVIQEGDRVVATPAFLLIGHRFRRYSDTAMHYECFQAWPHSLDFVSAFNDSPFGLRPEGSDQRHHMLPDGTIEVIGPNEVLPAGASAGPRRQLMTGVIVAALATTIFFIVKPHLNKSSPVPAVRVRFIGEQDGPTERDLKARLSNLFAEDSEIATAYLVKAELTRGVVPENSVMLAIRRSQGDSAPLRNRISELFASVFPKNARLDIAFLTPEKEAEVAAVAKPFYRRKG